MISRRRSIPVILLPALGALLCAQDNKSGEVPHPVGNGVSAPFVIHKVDPDYTEEARAAKLEGSVLVSVVVGSDGKVHQVNVVKRLGMGLDAKAIEAVQKWRFKPGMLNGEPVAVIAQIELRFQML